MQPILIIPLILSQVILEYTTRFSAIFNRSGYFRLISGGVRRPHAWRQEVVDRSRTEHFYRKYTYFSVKLIKWHISKLKYNRRRKSMQEIESIMVRKLKIPSLGITVRHHSGSLVMPNSYPHDGIFNPHLTTITDSYNQVAGAKAKDLQENHLEICKQNMAFSQLVHGVWWQTKWLEVSPSPPARWLGQQTYYLGM